MTEKTATAEAPKPKPRRTSKVRKASSRLATVTQALHKEQKAVARMQVQMTAKEQRVGILLKAQKEAKEELDRALAKPEE